MAAGAHLPDRMGENGLALAWTCMVLTNLILQQTGSILRLYYSGMFKSS